MRAVRRTEHRFPSGARCQAYCAMLLQRLDCENSYRRRRETATRSRRLSHPGLISVGAQHNEAFGWAWRKRRIVHLRVAQLVLNRQYAWRTLELRWKPGLAALGSSVASTRTRGASLLRMPNHGFCN